MLINSSGNVGIGWSSPSDFTSVNADNLVVGPGTGSNGITVFSATNAYGQLAFADGTGTNDQYKGLIQYAHPDDSMRLFTGNTERMRIDSSGNVGIGTTSPSKKLHVVGSNHILTIENTSAVADRYAQMLIQAGTATNYIWTQNQNSTTYGGANSLNIYTQQAGAIAFFTNGNNRRMTIASDGNVGIGTASPSANLHVSSASTATLKVITTGVADASVNIQGYDAGVHIGDATNGLRWAIWNDGPSTSSSLKFGSYALGTWYSDGAQVVTMTPVGNIGIGTTSPGSKLEVKTSGANTTVELDNSDTDYTLIQYNAQGATKGFSGFNAGFMLFGGESGTTTRLQSGGSYAATILENGNFGIGTTSPSFQLSIENHATTTSTATMELDGKRTNGTDGPVGEMIFSNNGDTFATVAGVRDGADNSGSIVFQTQDSGTFGTRMTISSDGNVGIGVSNPETSRLLVRGSTNDSTSQIFQAANLGGATKYAIRADGDNKWYKSDNSLSMVLTSGGNVGIGTTSPTNYKLEVNGTVEGSAFSVDGASSRIFAPAGATYNGSGTQTGYLIVKLPDNGASGINNMMTGVIRVFDYTFHESFDVHFAGYWYSGYNWTNCTAWIDSASYEDRNFTVRFGAMTGAAGAGTRPYITIADSASTWSYCKFSVINYEPGHSNYQAYKWDSGWNMDISATNPGVFAVTISNCQVNNWARIGQDLYYGSGTGNVGIGTTLPDNQLTVKATNCIIDAQSTADSQTIGFRAGYLNNPTLCGFFRYTTADAQLYIDNEFTGNNGVYSDINFRNKTTGGVLTSRMKIKGSTGNVGIGTTSPRGKLQINGNGNSWNEAPSVRLWDTTNSKGWLVGNVNNYTAGDFYIRTFASVNADPTSASQEFTIKHATGNVGIGNTSPQTTLHTGPTTTVTNAFTARFAASNFFASGGNSMFYVPDAAANIMMFGSNQFGTNQIEFYHKNPGTSQAYVGRISTSGSATSYVTSSDYRLKENIVPISESISRLNQLKPSRFNFIEEPGKVVDGFIAHEVQDIVPEAIVGEKDEVDEEGGIVPQGIDQAKLVPLLVAAVQELEARVKELENK